MAPRVVAPSAPTAVTTATTGQFYFQTPLEYQFRRGEGFHDPEAIAIADINGDGRDDLIGAARYNQILVWLQRADGVLADLVIYPYANEVYLNRGELVVADFNNDNVRDVAMSGLRQEPWGVDNSVINLLLSGPGGNLSQKQISLDGISDLGRWQTLDVDRDGNADIVGTGTYSFPAGTSCGLDGTLHPSACPAIGIAYGDGKGGFSRLDKNLLGTPEGIRETEVGDVDGDGMRDLFGLVTLPAAFGTVANNEIRVFKQRAVGGFEPSQTLFTMRGQLGTTSFAVADVNRDGEHRADVISVEYDSLLRVRDMSANGAVSSQYDPFTPPDRGPVWANAVLAQDVDGDRRGDALMSQMQWMGTFGVNQIALYLQQNGALQAATYIDAPAPHSGLTNRTLALGDLNGDGCKDLAMAGANYRLALIYGRQCAQAHAVSSRPCGIANRHPLPPVKSIVPGLLMSRANVDSRVGLTPQTQSRVPRRP